MPERSVILNFLTRGGADTRNEMRVISREASHLDGMNVELKLGAKDEEARRKFVAMNLMGDKFQRRVATMRLGINDKDATLKLDRFAFKIKKITDRRYDAKIGLDGFDKMMLEIRAADLALDRLGRKNVDATVGVHRSLGSRLAGAGSGGGNILKNLIGKGQPSGGSGLQSAATFGTSPGFLVAMGVLAPLLGALLPAVGAVGTGGLVGGGGAAAALALGSAGNKKLLADAKRVAALQRQLNNAPAGSRFAVGNQLLRADATQARDKSVFGALQPLAQQFTVFKNSAMRSLAQDLGPIAKALGPIMKQIASFIRSEGPALTAMFKASIPFIRMFVQIFERVARIIFPAITAALKQMQPFLPMIVRGFVILAKAFGSFLENMGPTFKQSSIVFVAVMKIIGILLVALGRFAANSARLLESLGHAVMNVAHFFRIAWDDVVKWTEKAAKGVMHWFQSLGGNIHNWFFDVWHFINNIWHKIWDGVTSFFKDSAGRLVRTFQRIGDNIHNWFFDAWHFINNQWHKIWDWVVGFFDAVGRRLVKVFKNLGNDIHNWFFDAWHFVNNQWHKIWDWAVGFFSDAWHRLMKVFKNLGNDIHNWFFDIWHFINGIWDKLWTWVSKRLGTAWHNIVGIAKNLWNDVTGFFRRIKNDVTGTWDKLWSTVKNVGKTAINWVIDNIINKLGNIWNTVVSALHLPGGLKFPHVARLAEGGWIEGPGGPREDNHPAMLSTGERVLSVQEVSHMGGKSAVDSMAGGPGENTSGHGGFAGGGTAGGNPIGNFFGSVGSFFSGIWSSLSSKAKGLLQAAGTVFSNGMKFVDNLAGGVASKGISFIDNLIFSHLPKSGITGMIGGVAHELISQIIKKLTSLVTVATSTGTGVKGMKNPFRKIKGLTPERIDMGVDFGGSGPIFAIGPGTIGSTMNAGWPGGAFIEERLGAGTPYAGKFVFQAENITPRVHRGQKVDTNTVIGIMHGGIEAGWGAGTGGLAMAAKLGQQAHSGDPGAHPTAMGHNFDELLVALGVRKAPNFGQRPVGKVPPGFFSKHDIQATASIGNLGGGSNAAIIGRFLLAHGLRKRAVAGIMGNMFAESTLNPEARENSRNGGLIGFTPMSRWGVHITGNVRNDLANQLNATMHYIAVNGSVGDINRHSSSVDAATFHFMSAYERPGIPRAGVRIGAARRYFAQGFKYGGMITEPIFGVGVSGRPYTFGEGGVQERVTPVRSGMNEGGFTQVNVFNIAPLGDPDAQAQKIHSVLREYKRHKGNKKLGLD